ncbi:MULTISPECIES: helix-turn-helix transcriptional regulator [Pandoraea]|uniref:AraC family transcriptional regulator n=1 Tax=Pandoraea TaxID=93217 RepID=UPI000847CFCE|nr:MULTISPECIES: helix-turn-helix transcriptional regulator [Pandoraea]MCI3205947.1 AraC family transcriptional regulator [Pandoraea sp. LA3]MDN4583975.1 AraC family transcriptional regulator [Pandoraea capi]ODP34155.1 AraC family transcriptional regulator [Pandoraea sp. ISTKB]
MNDFLRKRFPNAVRPLPRDVYSQITSYRHGERLIWHQHRHGQLAFAVRGVVRVLTSTAIWTLPPSRAVWLPSDVEHELHAVGDAQICNVYMEPRMFPWDWVRPTVILVTPLIRELAVTVGRDGDSYGPTSRAALSVPPLLGVLRDATALPERGVPVPRDTRLQAICEHLMNDPASKLTLDFWGEQFGVSGRTLARHFQMDTGMTFVTWRQHLRVSEAISTLALGSSVAATADAFGYASPSAFIAMFKQVTGRTPQRYLADA